MAKKKMDEFSYLETISPKAIWDDFGNVDDDMKKAIWRHKWAMFTPGKPKSKFDAYWPEFGKRDGSWFYHSITINGMVYRKIGAAFYLPDYPDRLLLPKQYKKYTAIDMRQGPGQHTICFVQGLEGGPIKIGVTLSHWDSFIRGMKNPDGHKVRCLAIADESKPELLPILHDMFKKAKYKGYWFNPDPVYDFLLEYGVARRSMTKEEYCAFLLAGERTDDQALS